MALLRYLSKEDFRVLTAVRLEHQDVNTRMKDYMYSDKWLSYCCHQRMLTLRSMKTDNECISSIYLQCFRGTGFR